MTHVGRHLTNVPMGVTTLLFVHARELDNTTNATLHVMALSSSALRTRVRLMNDEDPLTPWVTLQGTTYGESERFTYPGICGAQGFTLEVVVDAPAPTANDAVVEQLSVGILAR